MTINYEDMTVEQVVDYFNKEMKAGRSAKDIEINDFGVAERVIRKRLARKGIKIDTKKYDQNAKAVSQRSKSTKKVAEVVKQSSEIVQYEDSNTIVIPNGYEENLFKLLQNSDKILSLIKGYDAQYDAQYHNGDIVIELPIETVKDFRTSIRVNNVVWNQFNNFCEGKIFTKRDLISQALKEFMERYN